MLRQMGVDVWLARTGPADPLSELSVPRVSVPEDLPVERPGPAPARAAGPAVAPFSVACLSKGPVLMLIELGPSKAARRFALDLLAAGSGMFGGESTQLAFDWPQPGVDNNAEAVRKALSAFLSKQIDDLDPSTLLIGREVADRLGQVPDGCILLAPLAELMVDGQKKRSLWTELEGRR